MSRTTSKLLIAPPWPYERLSSRRVALEQVADVDTQALIKAHAEELLSAFEQAVLSDGRDPTVIAGIAEARKDLRS